MNPPPDHVEDDEVVAATALGGKREKPSVAGPGAGRIDESETLEVRTERPLYDTPLHSTRADIRQVDIDGVRPTFREVGYLAAVGGKHRRDV